MKMSDVKIGMRLRNPKYFRTDTILGADIIVTEITERGFKYQRLDNKTICVHPRLGIVLGPTGEHFGYDGETDYEEVISNPVEEARINEINLRISSLQKELKLLNEELQKYGGLISYEIRTLNTLNNQFDTYYITECC